MEPFSESMTPDASLQVTREDGFYLGEIARWAKFLAVVGFIFCGIIVIMAFSISSVLSSMQDMPGTTIPMEGMGPFFTVIYILVGVLYFFPCYYLFNFAMKMKSALMVHDQMLLSLSLRNLKSCFKFFGIMTIIVLCLYALAIVGIAVGAGVGSMMSRS